MKVQNFLIICFSFLTATYQPIHAQGLSLGSSSAVGVDIAETPLNRPSPDQKNYFYKTPQTTENFFPSLLGNWPFFPLRFLSSWLMTDRGTVSPRTFITCRCRTESPVSDWNQTLVIKGHFSLAWRHQMDR